MRRPVLPRTLPPQAGTIMKSSSPSRCPATPKRILNALSSGKLVVAIMSPGHFTTGGHFIVLRGVKDGKILVADPASTSRSQKAWDLSIILNEAGHRAGAGVPYQHGIRPSGHRDGIVTQRPRPPRSHAPYQPVHPGRYGLDIRSAVPSGLPATHHIWRYGDGGRG